MTYFWLALAVGLIVIEVGTVNLVCIWFIIGSVRGLLTTFFTRSWLIQLTVFAAVSAISLYITKPLAEKFNSRPHVPTNSDRLIGKNAMVVKKITPEEKGRVSVDGLTWLARCKEEIQPGREVKILNIEGATLVVEPFVKQ